MTILHIFSFCAPIYERDMIIFGLRNHSTLPYFRRSILRAQPIKVQEIHLQSTTNTICTALSEVSFTKQQLTRVVEAGNGSKHCLGPLHCSFIAE